MARYINGADRGTLDPILDGAVANCLTDLDEDGQVVARSPEKTEEFVKFTAEACYRDY